MPEPNVNLRERKPRALLILFGLWTVLYVAMAFQSSSPFKGSSILGAGAPDHSTLVRFGAAVPERVHQGEWWRVGMSLLLAGGLLEFLFSLWFVWSLGKQLIDSGGTARALCIAIFGGAAGVIAHVFRHPDSMGAHTHSFLLVVACLGGFAGLGFTKELGARRIRRSALVTCLILGVMHWAFTREMPDTTEGHAISDYVPMVVSFLSGIALQLALRSSARSKWAIAPAWLGAGALVACIALQAPLMVGSAKQAKAHSFFEELNACEHLAFQIWNGRSKDPNELKRRIDRLPQHAFLKDETEARKLLATYLKHMDAIVHGDMPDPDGVAVRLRRAFDAWHQHAEGPLRKDTGLSARPGFAHYWKRESD